MLLNDSYSREHITTSNRFKVTTPFPDLLFLSYFTSGMKCIHPIIALGVKVLIETSQILIEPVAKNTQAH